MKALVIIAAVGVLLFAAAWWHSGRAKPGGPRGRHYDRASVLDETAHVAQRRGQLGGPGAGGL